MTTSIAVLGAGVAGLYSAILLKHRFPSTSVVVHDKLAQQSRSGWGVILKDNLLLTIAREVPALHAQIIQHARPWSNIKIDRFGEQLMIPNQTGHSICRSLLVELLREFASALGVILSYDASPEVNQLSAQHELVIDATGFKFSCNNVERSTEHLSQSRFIWLGCDRAVKDMVFSFARYQGELFWTHIYPFSNDLSTVVLEAHQSTLQKLMLEAKPLTDQVAIFEQLFSSSLHGAHLLTLPEQSQQWRTFNQYHSERISDGNIVYLGDRAFTAHFSIGSGTALAVLSASELVKALEHCDFNVTEAINIYQQQISYIADRVQVPARYSMNWFDQMNEHIELSSNEFARAFMTRTVPGAVTA